MSQTTKHPRVHLAKPGETLTLCGQSSGLVPTVPSVTAAKQTVCGYCLATRR